MITLRNAAKVMISAALTATLIGAPFRCCYAEQPREHGPPPPAAVPAIVTLSPSDTASLAVLSTPALPLAPITIHAPHAVVERTTARTFLGVREHFSFATTAGSLEERQRRQMAIHLGRAVSQRGDTATASRIAEIYASLRLAQWGRHANGLLGGHFNFDYSAVRCVDFDRLLPHGRYGTFASLHFHHDQQRVHLDTANPFGLVGLLAPVHIFVDVLGGHLPWRNRQPPLTVVLNAR
jgi:hypothetical protein